MIHLAHWDHLVEAVDLVQDSHAAAIQQPVANLAVTALPLFNYIYNYLSFEFNKGFRKKCQKI